VRLIPRLTTGAFAAALIALPAVAAPPKVDPALREQTLEILKKSIAFPTVAGRGQTPAYAAYVKSVLVTAGFKESEIEIREMAGTAWLTARYPGADPTKKAIVVSGHMDVVEARREDWARDPFVPVVEGGYVYGRGANDNKFDVSVVVATLANLRKQGWKPGRDIVLALSGDEETVMATTADLAQRLKGAEMVLNADGGGGSLDEAGKPIAYGIQGAEKTYADFTIGLTDPGGHSSRPTPTNAIYRLTRALDRLAAYRFPPMQNEITKAQWLAQASNTPGPDGEAMRKFAADPKDPAAIERLSANPSYNAGLRTTCVTTMISGGHAPNALPQKASATVNCRIFPGTSSESVRQTLVQVIAEPTATVTRVDDGSIDSPASPLRPDLMAAITKAVHAQHPGLPVVPSQAAGATDSMHFRAQGVPSYGVSGLFMKSGDGFSHGLNEKAPVGAIDGSLAHWDSILRDLAK